LEAVDTYCGVLAASSVTAEAPAAYCGVVAASGVKVEAAET
jgi:hypothetical protein